MDRSSPPGAHRPGDDRHGLWTRRTSTAPSPSTRRSSGRMRDDRVFLVMVLSHGQQIGNGSARGHPVRRRHRAAVPARRVRPFLDRYLKDGARLPASPGDAFETGTNTGAGWRPGRPDVTPGARCARPRCTSGRAEGRFHAARARTHPSRSGSPTRPSPFPTQPPMRPTDDGRGELARWLVDDQRDAASARRGRLRLRALTAPFTSPPAVANLVAPRAHRLRLGGEAHRRLPGEVAATRPWRLPAHVSADVFRGATARAWRSPPHPGREALPYASSSHVNHVFRRATASWSRSSRAGSPSTTATPDVRREHLLATPGDYRKATQRVHHAPGLASFVELPVVVRD